MRGIGARRIPERGAHPAAVRRSHDGVGHLSRPGGYDGGYFPIVNATTTDFRRPFAMHLPRNEVASGRPLQMQVRRLQYRTGEKTLPARQLWGAVFGELH